MPNINRIRIVNFSYNHDSRHIVDETFNFHGGEDALLNLSNGGGKSVLVQLFLQVIVPGAKIQGRNIASFFRSKSQPAYIMIEWKLDSGGGYLLTGIGITSAEAVEGEGARPRVRYFNFTSKYSAANAYDIMNIPVITRNEGVLELKTFREARKILADKERKDPYLVGYYPEDDMNGYAKRLAEFGISQDEWRNVIIRINDSENGLEDLFQKYRNSSQLLDGWIIKTVENVIFKGRSQPGQLEEMLQRLVQEVIENEHFIMEKQLFTGFLDQLRSILDELETLLKNLEKQKHLGAKLAALYLYLRQEIKVLQDQQQTNEQSIKDSRVEEQRLNLEERSYQYQIRLEEHREALVKLTAAENDYLEIDEQFKQAKRQERLMEGARLTGEIRRISAELAGVTEKLAMAREDYDKDEQARRLEYTLKMRLKELVESLDEELSSLQAWQASQQEMLNKDKKELGDLESEKSLMEAERGRLEERRRFFTELEKQVQIRLGQPWIRNLLGELDSGEMDRIHNSILQTRNQLLAEHEKLLVEKTVLGQRQKDMDQKWKETQAAQAENQRIIGDYKRERAEYLKKEEEVKEVLDRYGFDSFLLGDQERLLLLLNQKINEIKTKREATIHTHNEINETLNSIKNGHLHTPKELSVALAELDIQYDSGESYLSNQIPEIRQAMLASNPILPYAFIMPRSDIARIAEAELSMVMRRVIPLMAYEDLDLLVENQGRIARPREGIAFACLYEGRVFDNENLPKLLEEMETKRLTAWEQCEHFSQAHEAALMDHATCQRFNYTADYYYQLEKRIEYGQKCGLDLKQQLIAIDEEKQQAINYRDQLDQEERNLANQLPPAEAALGAFNEFMEKEPDYQSCRGRLNQIARDIAGINERKEALNQSLSKLHSGIFAGTTRMAVCQSNKLNAEQKCLLYQDAAEAEALEGNIESLEERLIAIKGKYNQEIEQLEELRIRLTSEHKKFQKQINKLGLSEEDYSSTLYNEIEADSIHEQVINLEAVLKEKQKEQDIASRAEAAAAEALSNAFDEVKRLGYEFPLPPQEIKGDFEGRQVRLRKQIQNLEEANQHISRQIAHCRRTRENIEQTVDLSNIAAEKDFAAEQDFMAQASRYEREYRNLQNENGGHINEIRDQYADCKIDFRNKNSNLDNIFKGLDPLWNKARAGYEDFFYLFERMSLQGEKLAELIAIYESQLANLERNKQDMIQQSFLQGRRMMEEINLISENSKVRLAGRSRPVQMLKIDLQLDSHEGAHIRISQYIDECIRQVREKSRQENRSDELRKTTARLMSSRELLNVYLGNAQIPVQVFKIDLSMQNSRFKIWEDAVRENSGGEKFVIFFSLLSALMAYTRTRSMEALGADPDTATRVLIMDNPFGPISSEHLLKPMFEIAKRHRTQLICLSDLKQNSIMNCFNLIYMLKVRTSAIGGAEYLKFEEYVRDENMLSRDENLEKALYRVSDIKQMPLFD